MGKSDVFLRKNRVEVVGGGGKEVSGGREQGDLEVTVGKDKDPSVTLNADRANVTLGGGAGNAPEGDVKLLDQGGAQRVKISAESDGANPTRKESTVIVDGGAGKIMLASTGNRYGALEPSAELNPGTLMLAEAGSTSNKPPTITLNAGQASATLGGGNGRGTDGDIRLLKQNGAQRVKISAGFNRATQNRTENAVTVDGGTGTISLATPGNRNGTLEPSAELSPGNLKLAPPGSNTPKVTLDASTGDVDVGGSPGEAGDLTVRDEQGAEAVTISASKGASVRAGDVELYNTPGIGGLPAGGVGEFRDGVEAGVQIQGPMASIRLGYSFVQNENAGNTQFPVSKGKSGSIFLDDGNVGKFGLGKSMVFEVRASEGKLQVAADSSRLFEIDPGAGKIKVPKGWSLDDSLPKYNP